jgi:hypothetical protein
MFKENKERLRLSPENCYIPVSDGLLQNHTGLAMKRKTAKKQFPARRKFNLRRDATVATGQREIERVFGLPEGSVRLHLPSGRPARADKSIDALLDGYARR